MDVLDLLNNSSENWVRETPASSESIRDVIAGSKIKLPEEYLALLQYSNGGEGELAIEPGWFQLWPAEKVVELNREYEVNKNVPGLFGFGSNGGDEMLAFDTRAGKPWKVIMIPFIPMTVEHIVVIAEDFKAFVQAMGHEYSSGLSD
jgi:hypothetical protein